MSIKVIERRDTFREASEGNQLAVEHAIQGHPLVAAIRFSRDKADGHVVVKFLVFHRSTIRATHSATVKNALDAAGVPHQDWDHDSADNSKVAAKDMVPALEAVGFHPDKDKAVISQLETLLAQYEKGTAQTMKRARAAGGQGK